MNMRFAENSIRLRVTSDEFAQLRIGKAMALEVSLPRGHLFRAKLNMATNGHWRFDSDPTGMWISVPRNELDALADDLPSKEGIVHAFATAHGELEVSLEVDVKPNKQQ
jgi:hypothetical protein